MIHLTDATGLLGSALAIVALGAKMPGVSRIARANRGWLLAAMFVAALIPVGGLPLAGYLRGAIGDLSITSLLLLCAALLQAQRGWPSPPGRDKLLLAAAATGAVFYPLALGWGDFDPYRLGYGSYGLIASLLGLALLAAWKRLPMLALAIALAVGAWSAGWYESGNLWDYLLDPLVSAYAAIALIARRFRRLRAG